MNSKIELEAKNDKKRVVSVIKTRPGATHHEHAKTGGKSLNRKMGWPGSGVIVNR